MKRRYSVFWIRADTLTNFIVDYGRILEILKTQRGDSEIEISQTRMDVKQLNATRAELERHPDSWLVILDNLNQFEDFYSATEENISISSLVPRRGRLLITTRDQRFQGSFASANDGQQVAPLLSDEAEELLLRSIPARLRRTEPEKTHRHALILLDELGRLPLAIAQAAANIRDQNLSLAEYADLYKDKSQRMDLLRLPAEDSFKADPSKSSQSIFITWEISSGCLGAGNFGR